MGAVGAGGWKRGQVVGQHPHPALHLEQGAVAPVSLEAAGETEGAAIVRQGCVRLEPDSFPLPNGVELAAG